MNQRGSSAVKDQILDCISHDLKTPLNAMMGYAMLMEQQGCDAERVKFYAARIRGSGEMLASMINDVMDYAADRSGIAAEEHINLKEFLEEAAASIEPQMQRKDQSFAVQTEGGSNTSFKGDKIRLMRVLLNLLSNAVKYTQENGNIKLTVLMGRNIDFVIEDDGIGMSSEFQESVFEPFAREKSANEPGTGLGMFIVKELIDEMGGSIEIKSRPGKGTAVRVSLRAEYV